MYRPGNIASLVSNKNPILFEEFFRQYSVHVFYYTTKFAEAIPAMLLIALGWEWTIPYFPFPGNESNLVSAQKIPVPTDRLPGYFRLMGYQSKSIHIKSNLNLYLKLAML